MKTLKAIIVLTLGLLIANATYASENTGATATSASASGSGNYGVGLAAVSGTNGSYVINSSSGSVGSLDSVTEVENVNSVSLTAASPIYGSHAASAQVVIPSGATGYASYSVTNSAYGSASASIGSYSFSAGNKSSKSGSVTLSPGTYSLSTSSSNGYNSGTSVATVNLSITLDD